MTLRDTGVSPPSLARLGGFLYLLLILGGIFGEFFVRGGLIVGGDPIATAARLREAEGLWRAGIALDLFLCACTIGLAWIFYGLLRVVDRNLALLMLLFEAVAICLVTAFDLHLLAALFPLGSAAYLRAFTPEQLALFAYLSVRSYTLGFGIGLLFFGLAFPVRGYLIVRSGFLPKWLGVLLTVAGIGYVVHGFVLILAPALAGRMFPFVAPLILAGEGSLSLWLLAKGVRVEQWRLKAG